MGLTAFPEYPETALSPDTSILGFLQSRDSPVMLLTVFIAAIPSAPALTAAIAGISICPMLGVIFASTGKCVPLLTAAVYIATSSGLCPTSEPSPFSHICGQLKLHSIMSEPASVTSRARLVHSSSFCPIIEATITLFGKSLLSRFKSSKLSFRSWSEICSKFLKPINGVLSLFKTSNLGETSFGFKKPIVLKAAPAQPALKASAHIS